MTRPRLTNLFRNEYRALSEYRSFTSSAISGTVADFKITSVRSRMTSVGGTIFPSIRAAPFLA